MIRPYYEDDHATIYNGDCLDVLPNVRPVSLVVTDPPYNLSLQSTGINSGWGDLMNGAYFYAQVLREIKSATKMRQGAAWIFNSWRCFPVIAKASFEADWNIESLMVWDKQWIGPGGTSGLRPSYELVALFRHEAFAIENRSVPDIWRSKYSGQKPNGHPAEKPEALVQRIIDVSGGGTVLDPFMGSGTTLVAAKRQGQKSVGIEIEERWCEVAAKRLSQGELVGDLTTEEGK